MESNIINAAYMVSALLFIFSLAGLSKQQTAQRGNLFGMIGMSVALIATIADPRVDNVWVIITAMVIGSAIGLRLANKVEMTQMPELVAILHSFVGLAAVLVGYNSYFDMSHGLSLTANQQMEVNIHLTEVFIGVFIGAVTFTGSVVAFGKLNGLINSSALMLPHRHKMNLVAGIIAFILMVLFVQAGGNNSYLIIMTAIALVFGWHLVASIGGADMPVVVSMLNSYSGWAAAAAGFMLSNDLLIITGALVGSSGAILSYIMCKAMNRSFISVIAGVSVPTLLLIAMLTMATM
jgi:NAD(P) transhydrogenase subunit beta